VQTQDIMPR